MATRCTECGIACEMPPDVQLCRECFLGEVEDGFRCAVCGSDDHTDEFGGVAVILLNPSLLRQFRLRPCELSGAKPPNEAHHIIRKGIGGASQIDHPWNLLTVTLWHHQWIHQGMQPPDVRVPTARDLWRLVAKREGVEFATVERVMFCVKRLPRSPRPHDVERETEGFSDRERAIVEEIVAQRLGSVA